MAPPRKTPEHGTYLRYKHVELPCHAGDDCPASPTCAEAYNAWFRDYRRGRPKPKRKIGFVNIDPSMIHTSLEEANAAATDDRKFLLRVDFGHRGARFVDVEGNSLRK